MQKTLARGLCALALGTLGLASAATAAPMVYTDTQGDQVGSSNKARDIWSASIDNDALNLIVTINLDPAASLGTTTFKFGIGITTGPGANGDLATDSVFHGNPYKDTISIASSQGGMIDWVGLFPAGGNGTSIPWTSYGFNIYNWSASGNTWGAAVDTVASGQTLVGQNGNANLSSVTAAIPFSYFTDSTLTPLNLQPGSTFLFDIYDTGSGNGQTAYDSLADASPTNGTNSGSTQYDGSVLLSYTIQAVVPEPVSMGILAVGALAGLCRRTRRD